MKMMKRTAVALAVISLTTALHFTPPAAATAAAAAALGRWIANAVISGAAWNQIQKAWHACGPGCRTELRIQYCRQKNVQGADCVRALKQIGLW